MQEGTTGFSSLYARVLHVSTKVGVSVRWGHQLPFRRNGWTAIQAELHSRENPLWTWIESEQNLVVIALAEQSCMSCFQRSSVKQELGEFKHSDPSLESQAF